MRPSGSVSGSYGLETSEREGKRFESDAFLMCMVGSELSEDSRSEREVSELQDKKNVSRHTLWENSLEFASIKPH